MLVKEDIRILSVKEIRLNGEWVKLVHAGRRWDNISWVYGFYTADIGTPDSQLWKVVALKEEN